MEQKPRGRPKGSKTRQERRKPSADTRVVSGRVSAHVAQNLAKEAESRGVAPGSLVAEAITHRYRCTCDVCQALKVAVRKWRKGMGYDHG